MAGKLNILSDQLWHLIELGLMANLLKRQNYYKLSKARMNNKITNKNKNKNNKNNKNNEIGIFQIYYYTIL